MPLISVVSVVPMHIQCGCGRLVDLPWPPRLQRVPFQVRAGMNPAQSLESCHTGRIPSHTPLRLTGYLILRLLLVAAPKPLVVYVVSLLLSHTHMYIYIYIYICMYIYIHIYIYTDAK